MHKHRDLKMTIWSSSREVTSELNEVWGNFLISTCRPQQSIKKIEDFYKNYIDLKKNRKLKKKSKKQKQKIDKFNLKLNQLVGIADNDKYQDLSENCKQFLNECRKTRCCNRSGSNLLDESLLFLIIKLRKNHCDAKKI